MLQHTLLTLVPALFSLAAVLVVMRQCRKPWSAPGRLFIWLMNRTHAGVTAWGLRHVAVSADANVLEVGCGGGRTLRTLAGMCRHVDGIDYSPTCVAAAKRTNADLVADGRVVVQQASVSNLPFPDSSFDLVAAVETHYYWPAPIQDLQEVLRVLKPGGTLLLIAETYKRERSAAFLMIPMLLLQAHYLTLDEHCALLNQAGFADVAIDHEPRRGWMCGVARRSPKLPA